MTPYAEAAIGYIRRGWSVVRLHALTPTGCSCQAGDLCKTPAKHPVGKHWQQRGITTEQQAIIEWSAHPSSGVGIITGRPSGIWVLDFDPKNAKPEAFELVKRLMGITREHLTGSGGLHFIFQLPVDFEPANSQNRPDKQTSRLPQGLDVRGRNGQIVAPPSRNSSGAYSVYADRPVLPAPLELEDLIRPAPSPPQPPRETRQTLALSEDGSRERTYCMAGIEAACSDYEELTDGRRGEAAAAMMRSVVELCNTANIPLEFGQGRVEVACERARWNTPDNPGGYLMGEVEYQFRRAVEFVNGAVRQIPPGVIPEYMMVPPVEIQPRRDPVTGEMTFTPVPTLDPLAPWIGPPTRNREPSDRPQDPVAGLIWEMRTAAQLEDIPDPVPLVEDAINLDSEVWAIAASGSFKTFVALDLAGCVGRGIPWHGLRTRQGLVIYIVAEGVGGIKMRKRAWEKLNGSMENVIFLPRPVQADERRGVAEWTALIEACRQLQPALIVIDTQARVTVGFEENSASDMGIYVEQVRRLKNATAAAVLTVHHTGKRGADGRGSSALYGAADTEIKIERVDRTMICSVSSTKMKDGAERELFKLSLTSVEVGRNEELDKAITSLVPVTYKAESVRPRWVVDLPETHKRAMEVLYEHFGEIPTTRTEAHSTANERYGTIPRTTWNSAWSTLAEKRRIVRVRGDRWLPSDIADRLGLGDLDDTGA